MLEPVDRRLLDAQRRPFRVFAARRGEVGAAGSPEGAGGVNQLAIKYLNRLSDLLFILARTVNAGAEPLWVPGGKRDDPE